MSRESLQRTWNSIDPDARFNLFLHWIVESVRPYRGLPILPEIQIQRYEAPPTEDRSFRLRRSGDLYVIEISSTLFRRSAPEAPNAAEEALTEGELIRREILQNDWNILNDPGQRFNLFGQWIADDLRSPRPDYTIQQDEARPTDAPLFNLIRSASSYTIVVSSVLFTDSTPDAALEIAKLISIVIGNSERRRTEIDNARKVEADYWKQFKKLNEDFQKDLQKDYEELQKSYGEYFKFMFPDWNSSYSSPA